MDLVLHPCSEHNGIFVPESPLHFKRMRLWTTVRSENYRAIETQAADSGSVGDVIDEYIGGSYCAGCYPNRLPLALRGFEYPHTC